MAGEAVSRTSLTSAFQKKQNLEWRKLREHLHLQLQQDISRIYTNSLYCDLELVFNSASVQTHRSILEVRAARFYTKLCTIHPAPYCRGLQSVVLKKASVDFIEGFIRSLYTKCDVSNEENAVRYLEGLHDVSKFKSDSPALCNTSSGDSGLSPESDIYLTPKSSPSEIFNLFEDSQKLDFETNKTESTETIINLQKTNRSYYKIVQVDESFIEENNCTEDDVLEKELAEQDELLKSFRSIKSKEEKKINIKKPIKPTSLPFTSSHFTKKKQSCDILNIRNRKEGKGLLDSKLQASRCKEDLISVNFNYCTKNSQRKDNFLVDKSENREHIVKEKEERDVSVHLISTIKKPACYSESNHDSINNDILEEEEFMESPGEGMDCELECCKRKDVTTEDLLNFACSPEMDASGGGPDSGLDTSSTGCMPGGGFSSPREHTVSETSGVDLTEAAIGEDMPHDGDVEILLQKPVKSSTSSSVSSDAGTWDSTFPSTNLTALDGAGRAEMPTNAEEPSLELLNKSDDKGKLHHDDLAALNKVDNVDFKSSDENELTEVEAQHSDKETLSLESKLIKETESDFLLGGETTSVFDSEQQNVQPKECAKLTADPCYNTSSYVQETLKETDTNSSTFESLAFCTDGASSWRLSNQNNYFINAADLADEVEMLLPPAPVICGQTEKAQSEIESPELEVLPKSSGTPSPCEENPSSTCDIVNKGIIDCFNIKAKYVNTDTLPVEAHSETFSEDVVPFISSHLTITDEKVLLNAVEQNSEATFQTSGELVTDPLLAKLTPFKATNGKHDLRASSRQDIFAEFEKEIKMTEHLEPHINVRKIHGSWKRMDSSGSDDMNKRESHSLPADIFSDSDRCENLLNNVLDKNKTTKDAEILSETSKDVNVDHVSEEASAELDSKQDDQENLAFESESSQKDDETEPRRPSLIRRNTFELDPDDDRLALLRQEYERRQGNLLFQSCIPQFSGHLTGSEGFRDAQSLMMVSTNNEDLNGDELHQRSLPVIPAPTTTLSTTASYEDQVLQSQTLITDHIPSRMFSNREIHTPDSLNNDAPLDNPFHTQINHNTLSQQKFKNNQILRPESRELDYHEKEKYNGATKTDNEKNGSDKVAICRTFPAENVDVVEHPKDDIKRMSSSFDNSTKPVISGALTCSDVFVDEKRSCDSPKKQKRTESTPIVSGGVSSTDYVVPSRPVSDSPIMSRRKNESAPILSGGATIMVEPEEEKTEIKPTASMSSSVTSAWVVDMSDCSAITGKPPVEPRKQKKIEMVTSDAQSGDFKELSQRRQSEVKTAPALGFFVDLKDSPLENQVNKKPIPKERKEIVNEKDSKSHESSPVRRNSGVGFFVDLKENTETIENKLSSEVRDLSPNTHVDEAKSSFKNISCGFFVNLKENDQKKLVTETVAECKKVHDTETDKKTPVADKKNAIFSMFIDIGESGNKQDTPTKQGSAESLRSKVSSPHLSAHKKLGFKNNSETPSIITDAGSKTMVQTGEETESPKSAFVCIDANHHSTKLAGTSINSTSQEEIEHKENKKQGFFMFIETESPVTRRKTLPSGLRPSLNRHSWNLEPRPGEQTDDQKINGRKHHKRAHSLSVERGSVCSPSDDSKSSSTASLAKSRMRGSSQSLHEAVASPEQGSLTHFGEGISGKQMSSSCHSRLPSKSFDRLPKRTLSYEGKSDSGKETPDIDTISEGKVLGEGDDISMELDDRFPTRAESFDSTDKHEICSTLESKTEKSSSTSCQTVISTHEEEALIKSEVNSKKQNKIGKTIIDTGQENSSVENVFKNNIKDSEPKKSTLEGKKEVESKSLETSFVKLSDLDKEPSKPITNGSESSDILPSFAAANRMTRSIPETSWIESKLLMTRSIGGGTSSKSLSRLFPHLHTTVAATTSPSNIGRSKSPNTQDADDNDTQISETSDLSSMQSSMGPSGLEGSTEETDASSSYAGRSGPVSRLGEDLLRMFLEEINPDVTVEVGGRRLKAHKCILSSRCQYFAAILSGGWVESAGNVISLQGFSYNAVHFALCHIYSGTSNIPDSISIVELATLADMLGLEGLKEVIMYTLKVKYCHFFHKPCTMCAAGVLECLPLAAAYGLDDIYRKSLRWITKYFVRIWPTKGFASLPRELIEKCYQQHVVHMTVDNVLETVMCCDKLLATLPNVRWAEPVFGITSQLLEASIKFIANNFCGVLSSDSFLSLGKELSWNISRLEDSLMAATDRLPPDQACQSHTRLHNILTIAQSPEPPPEMQWSPNFVELLRRIQKRVEASLVRQAPRAARCPSWSQMELELRKKIQETACLVLVPGEDGHKSRHASLARRGESGGSNSVYCTAPRSVSSTGSRNLDIRQVKLAMTQQARRAASGGRVSTLRADIKSRSQSAKKSQQSSTHVPTHKAETVSSQAKKVVTENGESVSRPKTWPLRVLENKPKSSKQRANSSSSSMGTPEKSGAMPRRTGKTMISSSDSSRTSSPAMRRSTSSGEGSGRGRAATVGSSSSRNLLRRSETPPGKEVRSKKKKDGEVTMSTDSLSEPQSNGGCKRSTKEIIESVTTRSCISTRPDTPSVRRKLREEVAISTDSLAESVASGEKLPPKVETSVSAPSRSLGSTRPDTPPVKERGRKCLGRIGVEVTMSTDSLANTEQTFTGDSSSRKMEVNKIVTIPKSPTPKGSQQLNNRLDGSRGNLAKGTKSGEAKNEISQPRSPALAGRRVVMRQTIISPRDSPTFRLRSGVSSSPYTGSPSLRRSLLLATRSPTNDNAASVNNNVKTATPAKLATTLAKTEKVIIKSFPSPSTSVTVNKRTPTRLQTRNQSVASPVKSSGGVLCRASGKEAGKNSTPAKGVTNVSKTNNNATRKVVSNGSVNGRNKQNNNEVSVQNKRVEPSEDRPLTVGSRSGTFLKDEPTILKKPDVDNVQE